MSRRQALAAKAEFASFATATCRSSSRGIELLTLHCGNRNRGRYLAFSNQVIRLQTARRQSRNQEWSGSVLSRSDQLIV